MRYGVAIRLVQEPKNWARFRRRPLENPGCFGGFPARLVPFETDDPDRRSSSRPSAASRGIPLLSRFIPPEYGIANALHCPPGSLLRLLAAGVEDIPNLPRSRLEFFAACLNRLYPFPEIIRHSRLAFDAADARRPAALVGPGNRFRWRKQLVPREYRTYFGATWIGATLALGVRHHVANFLSNVFGRIAKPNRVVVALGHAATIGARQSRRLGQQVPRLVQQRCLLNESFRFGILLKEIIYPDCCCIPSDLV